MSLYVGEKEALARCRPYAPVGKRMLRQWREKVPGLFVKFETYQRGRYCVPVLEEFLASQASAPPLPKSQI